MYIFSIGTPCRVLNILLTVVVRRLAGKPDEAINKLLFRSK